MIDKSFEDISDDSTQLYEWQIEAIKEGIKEADAGNFATNEEVAKVFAFYGVETDLDTTS